MFVSSNGYTGFNFEHSWGDGVAVARFMQVYLGGQYLDAID